MNMNYNSIFINQVSQNWILDILGDDLFRGFQELGYKCRKGNYTDYKDEDVSFHMWWRNAFPHKKAKLNCVLITHTDSKIKEDNLIRIKNDFDYYFCMSPEDAQFLIELGYDKSKVFGINLPTRNTYIRPITIGIFSRHYPDKRKNEEWLFDFCKTNRNSELVDFVFIGDGWGNFVTRIGELGCTFQWHNVSRKMPYEYMYQQLKLTSLDYYIYMGMDGGAMGSYDAYAMGTRLCITDDGYHKGIPDLDFSFSTKEEFCKQLSTIVQRQKKKLDFFVQNNVENYVKRLSYIIENRAYPDDYDFLQMNYSVAKKRRDNYFKKGIYDKIYDITSSIYHWWKKILYNRKH